MAYRNAACSSKCSWGTSTLAFSARGEEGGFLYSGMADRALNECNLMLKAAACHSSVAALQGHALRADLLCCRDQWGAPSASAKPETSCRGPTLALWHPLHPSQVIAMALSAAYAVCNISLLLCPNPLVCIKQIGNPSLCFKQHT